MADKQSEERPKDEDIELEERNQETPQIPIERPVSEDSLPAVERLVPDEERQQKTMVMSEEVYIPAKVPDPVMPDATDDGLAAAPRIERLCPKPLARMEREVKVYIPPRPVMPDATDDGLAAAPAIAHHDQLQIEMPQMQLYDSQQQQRIERFEERIDDVPCVGRMERRAVEYIEDPTERYHLVEQAMVDDEFGFEGITQAGELDTIDTGVNENDRMTSKEKYDFEEEMDDILAHGDLDEIKEKVTVYNFTKCKTNSLEKSLEVSETLECLGKGSGPDEADFDSLSKSVEDYAVELLEPLKSDDMKRAIFDGNDFNRLAEKAVLHGRKKFVSHPVVYSLLMKRWSGPFSSLRMNAWTGLTAAKWLFLNMWAVFDVVLFPLVFAVLFLIDKIARYVRKRQDHAVVMVMNSTLKKGFYWSKMSELAANVIDKFDDGRMQYASLIRHSDGIVTNKLKSKQDALSAVKSKTNRLKTDNNTFKTCLKDANEMFTTSSGHQQNKTVVIMTDGKLESAEARRSIKEAERMKHKGIQVICVCFGVHPEIKQLKSMATAEEVIMYFRDDKAEDVMEKVIKGMKGYSVLDRYLQYFNTPYFIFVRDTLSYLALLGLHFALCLQPSTIHFTVLEWIIMLFFFGRLLMEIHQAITEGQLDIKYANHFSNSKRIKKNMSLNNERSGHNEGQFEDETTPDENSENSNFLEKNPPKSHSKVTCEAVCRVFRGMMSRYFSDWWNALDLLTLLVYIIILILRSITWAEHSTVPNNRLLAVAGYLYGLNTMFLTLRVFGHIMESKRTTGRIQIALFQIIGAVVAIFGQFLAATLAFSLAITKVYVVEISYKAGTNATAHGFCENSKGGIGCWWDAATHLIWSLLGIGGVEPLQSSDGPSALLAKLLYGIFLIMAVVMLMNMMIALLSNTYQQVEDNAFYEWSYRKATTIRTYTNYHPVPVPFNIISLAYLFIRHICRNLSCKRCCPRTDSSKSTVEKHYTMANKVESNSLFDDLILDLLAEYSALHGYEFPLTESGKMDTLLKETEGNHQLIGHIVDQVYKYDKVEAQQLADYMGNKPYSWDTAGIEVKGNQLRYLSTSCTCNDCFHKRLAPADQPGHHGAQFLCPLSKDWPGFEVLIQEVGDRHFIAIGVVPYSHKLHSFPGWEGNTAGYHVDDGRIFDRQSSKTGRNTQGAMARRGDLLGCKILFDEQSSKTGYVPVSFTINGRVIGKATVQLNKTDKELYPFVGIGWEGISVLFKMCSYKPAESLPQKKSDNVDKILSTVKQIKNALGENTISSMWQCQYYMRDDIERLKESVQEIQRTCSEIQKRM